MELMRCINRYDGIVQALMVRNAVLEETSRLRSTMPLPTQMRSAPVAVVNRPHVGYASAYPSLPTPSAAPVPAPRKPRDTWSAVVSSKDPKLTGKEVAEKVRREIAPTLGVRLHEMRGLARGGAIIRTLSSGEIKRVVASRKFGEIGLEVKPNTAQLPKLIVQDVATQIAPEEFMAELFANNLKEHIAEVEFRKAVHLDTKTWTVADGATVTVTLECEPKVLDLLEGGRIYVHILCVCPLYADLRHLDGLGLQHVGGTWTFGRILDSDDRMRRLEQFAEEVFRRRRGL
ncbi:hypothetical protein KR026_003279 [Drosophila bipectinata]|nr:hypothetical protein KR026_003279 [Drosophila bipectinata]